MNAGYILTGTPLLEAMLTALRAAKTDHRQVVSLEEKENFTR
jgi:hypothetical protein